MLFDYFWWTGIVKPMLFEHFWWTGIVKPMLFEHFWWTGIVKSMLLNTFGILKRILYIGSWRRESFNES